MVAASLLYNRRIIMYVESGGQTFEHGVIPFGVPNDSPTWRIKLTGNHWEALGQQVDRSPSPDMILDWGTDEDVSLDVYPYIPLIP